MSIINTAAHFADAAPTCVQTAAPATPHRGEYGRTFDLPPALFVLTVGAYLVYLGIMAAAFMNPELVIPMAIFVLFVVAGFGTPALWTRFAPPAPGRRQSLEQFMRDGFECATGHISGGGAATQVLIMPFLILGWGIIIAIIAASVR